MTRFRLLLGHELKLFRSAIPIHVVVILQPAVMYLLMAAILVHPTFDMYVVRPESAQGHALVAAMGEVGSPIGLAYINPIVVEPGWDGVTRQMIVVEVRHGLSTALQRYDLIDSNMVKNLRNRLTAAGLRVWDADLGDKAVTVEEFPWLPSDVPYSVYFGLAMLPMTAFLAASVIGAVLTAQEFEAATILEYRLAPAPLGLILGARLARLVLTSYVAVGVLLLALGLRNGVWPDTLWLVGLVLLPVAVAAGGLGIVAGLLVQKTIPAFLIGLVGSFVGWLLGSAFGLATSFSRGYALVSRLTPNTHAVELLFPRYYGTAIGNPWLSVLILVLCSGGMVILSAMIYRWRVLRQA